MFLPASKCPPFISFLHLLFWTSWVFFAARELSPVAESGAHYLVVVRGFSRGGARALGGRASFSYRGARAPVGGLQELWPTGFVAPWHVGSSQSRGRTRVPCTARWILSHWSTTEVPHSPSWKGPSHVELGPTRMTTS